MAPRKDTDRRLKAMASKPDSRRAQVASNLAEDCSPDQVESQSFRSGAAQRTHNPQFANDPASSSSGRKRVRIADDLDSDEGVIPQKCIRRNLDSTQASHISFPSQEDPIGQKYDVKGYTTKQMRHCQEAAHRTGQVVDPVPPNMDFHWKTNTREQAQQVANLVVEHRVWELVGGDHEGLQTSRELEATSECIYKQSTDELKQVVVNFPHYLPMGEALHTSRVMSGAGMEEHIDIVKEYVWSVWISREKFDLEISTAGTVSRIWYWTDDHPFNATMIGREKEQEILKFMAERPFPPEVLDNIPDSIYCTAPGRFKTWKNFNAWAAPTRVSEADRKEREELGVEDKDWNWRRVQTNKRKFDKWKREMTLNHFMAERRKVLNEQTSGKAAVPTLTYNPQTEKRKKWPQTNAQAAASLARTTARQRPKKR